MQALKLSILVPIKNIEQNITDVFSFMAEQTKGMNAEFIFVDMGSADKTVLQAVTLLKESGLPGFVIQNGDSSVPAALNTAVQRSGGKYLTFLFARRLYDAFLPAYQNAAEHFGADAVLGCFSQEELKSAERRSVSMVIRQPAGNQFVKNILSGKMKSDLAAFAVRKDFLISSQIAFDEDAPYGYADEFLLCCLLRARKIVQAPVLLQRNEDRELKRGRTEPAGYSIFRRIDAFLRVSETAKAAYPDDTELRGLFEKEAIPRAALEAVDVALREGVAAGEIRDYLSVQGYDRLLSFGWKTDPVLRRKLLLWNTLPYLYRP